MKHTAVNREEITASNTPPPVGTSGARTAKIKSENSFTSSNIEFKKQTLRKPAFFHRNKGIDLHLKKGEVRGS